MNQMQMRKTTNSILKTAKDIKNTVTHQTAFFISLKKYIFMYLILAKINKLILPSFTKQRLDLSKAKKWQMVIIGYRYYVTIRALDVDFKM